MLSWSRPQKKWHSTDKGKSVDLTALTQQEFIRPHTPQQNGLVVRLIRTVKEQCLWLHQFESLDEARQILRSWFKYYNEQRPHQAFGMKSPNMIYQQQLAA